MSSTVNLKATGLATQPNRLSLPEGSLVQASNCIIDRDNVIEKRRGFALYGNSMDTLSTRAKQLMQYRNQIIRHYDTTLQYDNGSGTFTSFPGSFTEPDIGLRIRSVAANNNFYFTTNQGIQKIAAVDSNLGNAVLSSSGAIKAIDIKAALKYSYTSTTGFLPADSTVAYRAVWGIKDINNNLLLGTPSPRFEVYNPFAPILVQDYMKVLEALDDCCLVPAGGALGDANYVSTLGLGINAAAEDLRTNLISLASKIDADIYTALPALSSPSPSFSSKIVTMKFASNHGLIPGDTISVSGIVPSGYNGNFTLITAATDTLTYSLSTDPGTYISGGTVKKIKYGFIDQPALLNSPVNHNDLQSIQDYLDEMILKLQNSPVGEIAAANVAAYLDPLDITTTATTNLTVYIPKDVIDAGVNEYFLQLYRSSISEATGTTVLTDLVPNDEMKLVYEAFPTSAELSAGYMQFEDITLDSFAGSNLYTNEASGEGQLQANDAPPFAKDIARFKNVIFYANTKNKHKKIVSLLGVSNMIADYNNSITPKITIADDIDSVTYKFVSGVSEVTDITCIADTTNSLNGKYFDIYSAEDVIHYRFYFKTSGGTDTPPSVPTNGQLVKIKVVTDSAANTVAQRVIDIINGLPSDFSAVANTLPAIRVTNVNVGYTTDSNAGNFSVMSGFSVTTHTQGIGQSTATTPKQILLSNSVSPAQAVDETARSLVNIINRDADSPVYAFYLSGAGTVPGKFFLESRELNTNPFYLITNNSTTGQSFNPDLGPTKSITAISSAFPTVITTSAPHGLVNGDTVIIGSSNSPTSIDGEHNITVVNSTHFSIPVDLSLMTPASYTAVYSVIADTEASENDQKPNRVFYSKLNQPEAVPLVNYFDVGDSDKAILRIFPLRNSLFVFKEEGLYRVSGEVAPFSLALFDSSCRLIAPDSLGVVANLIFGWTKKGIETISESGASLVSRNIDPQILKFGSSNYPNFSSATFGLGYESDKCYMVFTIQTRSDTHSTVCYRYNTINGSWTTFNLDKTCALVKTSDDNLYLGAGDINYIERERKAFDRVDYADRDYNDFISLGNYNNNVITLDSITNYAVGDSVVQTQTLTPYLFNMLLRKLDFDPGVPSSNYLSTLEATAGDDMKIKLLALSAKLDSDGLSFNDYTTRISQQTGSIGSQTIGGSATHITSVAHGLVSGRYVTVSSNTSTPTLNGTYEVSVIDVDTFSIPVIITTSSSTGTFITDDSSFEDLAGCFDDLSERLNADTVVSFNNYASIAADNVLESTITAINKVTRRVTLKDTLGYIVGPLKVYKAITSEVTYAPITMGDPLGYKHLSESTIMFENKAFTSASLSFSTDLLPSFNEIIFNGDGPGVFGSGTFGEGYYGGSSHGAPFRTLIPRNNQRCRYLNVKFSHNIARENVIVYGISVTGDPIGYSTRAYK